MQPPHPNTSGIDPVLVIMAADHLIPDLPAFHRCIRHAIDLARQGLLVTCDISINSLHLTDLDATISWTEGESPGSAAMPIADFRRYVASRAIRLEPSTAA